MATFDGIKRTVCIAVKFKQNAGQLIVNGTCSESNKAICGIDPVSILGALFKCRIESTCGS